MRGLAIITDDLNTIEPSDVVKWCKPLEEIPNNIGAVPIFECKSLTDYSLVINEYKPGSVILVSSMLAQKLYGPLDPLEKWQPVLYTIRIESWGGEEVTVLICPDAKDIGWERLEPALDRLEEIL
jgi:hypothetical protein